MLKIKAAKVWLHHQDMQSAQEKELKFVLVTVSQKLKAALLFCTDLMPSPRKTSVVPRKETTL
jgi:hypothetical protein